MASKEPNDLADDVPCPSQLFLNCSNLLPLQTAYSFYGAYRTWKLFVGTIR